MNLHAPNDVPEAVAVQQGGGAIRKLIWTYFFLLMFEGVLRKWVFPGLSNPLMLIRDPFLLTIYLFALGQGIFVFNGYFTALGVLGCLTAFLGITIGTQDPLVTAYGFDACFFHLPLIFIIPKVMTRDHVLALGKWVLILTIPMAVLMVMQFRAPPNAWINCGAGGGTGAQIQAALGKIRPPGFFTFINGAAQFLALSSVFLIYGLFNKITYRTWLVMICGTALVIAVGVSSSRLALGAIGLVFSMIGVAIYYDPRSVRGVVRMLIPIGLILLVATNLDVFKEGREVFEARLVDTGDARAGLGGTASNWAQRVLGDYYGWYYWVQNVPVLGKGLGMGTNVGARFLARTADYQSAEGEMARVIIEMGPIIGSFYLLLRHTICLTLFGAAARSARAGNVLPLLLFGSCVLLVSAGQFSQTCTLGFAVIGAGFCLASTRLTESEPVESGGGPNGPGDGQIKPRGCGPHAQHLHPALPGPSPGG